MVGRKPLEDKRVTLLFGTSQTQNLIKAVEIVAKTESSDKSKITRMALKQFLSRWSKENPTIKLPNY